MRAELAKRLDVKRPGIRARGDMIGIPLPNILDRWASHTGRCKGATAEKAVPFPSGRPSIPNSLLRFAALLAKAKPSLSRMNVPSLMELRKRVDERLFQHRAEIQKQLDAIALLGGERRGRRPGSALRGRKVPAKYRSRSGQTWATMQNMKSGSSRASVIVVS